MPHSTEALSPQDILAEVRQFISGAARPSHSTNTVELTRTGLSLLKNVPAAREAVLEYLCNVFSVAVNKHVRQIENNQNLPIPEENTIVEIQTVLSSFISSNAEAWAPIISAWSLDLLGKLSSDYANRGSLKEKSGINDFLQQWMSCRTTRTLIEITAQCLQCLMHSETESCINALLNTSVLHSPHFDWVVAHVGSCFPNTVITRVLTCGLKDFCANVKNPKLNSVVGILGHLAGSHFLDIRTALLDLFKWSLDENLIVDGESRIHKLATVPFLLNLAKLSPMLLKALTTDVLQIYLWALRCSEPNESCFFTMCGTPLVRPDVVPRLALFANDWCRYFSNNPDVLIDSAVELALGCEQGAMQIINILLDTSLSNSNVGYHSVNAAQSVKSVCREILESLLEKLDFRIRSPAANQIPNIPLLNSIKQDLLTVTPLLLHSNPLKVQTAVRLLSLLGTQSPNVLISSATFMLQNAETGFHLAALIRLISDNDVGFASKKSDVENTLLCHGYFTQVVEHSIREVQYTNAGCREVEQLFKNLTTLLSWENSNKVSCLRSRMITRAIRANLHQISCLLIKTEEFSLANDIAGMLDCLGPFESDHYFPSVELTLKMTRAIIKYFFICIEEDDVINKEKGVKIVCRFLRVLTSYSACARALAIRELLANSMFSDPAKFFGAKVKFEPHVQPTFLLHRNHKQGTSAMLAQRHSSVFHAGVIGHGPRKPPPENNIDKEIITLNSTLLMDVIKACCSNPDPMTGKYSVNSDILNMLSLLLVELVSPDVMYNGLPWPDEEFTKVTVERDLQIRRIFKDAPLLWTLLALTAWYRPALAYCSVLLRGIAATVIANWNKEEGVSLSNVMALGQLLPPPLASIRDILPCLENQQINTIMRECVWAYMHENVPSPALFTRPEGANIAWRDTDSSVPNIRFTETLRLILLANFHKLGPLYSTLFYNEHK